VTSCGLQRRRRASASCTCTPRFEPTSSCHSSTTTIFTLPSASRASRLARASDRLSGVVTSAVGSRAACRARSDAGVSAVRRPTVHAICMSASGAASARTVSAASARIGVTHRTVIGGAARVLNVAKAASAPSQTA
jgi:hypothetical protein